MMIIFLRVRGKEFVGSGLDQCKGSLSDIMAAEKLKERKRLKRSGRSSRESGPVGLEGCGPEYVFYWKCSRYHLVSDVI